MELWIISASMMCFAYAWHLQAGEGEESRGYSCVESTQECVACLRHFQTQGLSFEKDPFFSPKL